MKKRLAMILAVTMVVTLALAGCSKDKGPKDDEPVENVQDTSVTITMDTLAPVNAGTVLNIMDVAQVREDKADLVQQFGFFIDGTTFQEEYTVVDGENNVTIIAQFSDGTQFSEALIFTGVKSEVNLPDEIINKFKNGTLKVANGLSLTDVDGYDIVDANGTVTVGDITFENIQNYMAKDRKNDITSITVQSIDGSKEGLVQSSKELVQLLFGSMLQASVEESEMDAFLEVEGNEEKLTQAFNDFYNEIITTVEDGTVKPAEFYNVDGTIVTTPVEVTYLDTSFINGGGKIPLSYSQYLTVNNKLIGITYTAKEVDNDTDTEETKELPKVTLDDSIFDEGGVKAFFSKIFEEASASYLDLGVTTLTDVSFFGSSLVIGEVSLEEPVVEVPVENNTVEVGEKEPDTTEVVDIKDSQRKPYSERFKDYYTWPENKTYRYSRYIYVLSGLSEEIPVSSFVGSITNKKDGTIKVSGNGPDSIDTTTGTPQIGSSNSENSSGENSDSSDSKTSTSSLIGSSGRRYDLSNASLPNVVFDEVNATNGMVPVTFNGSKYYITMMNPTEISRVIGSTGTKPEQSLYSMNDFKGGEYLVTKDNSVTDGTTCYTLSYTSISDGTKKSVPYMACLPTVSSQDWIVIYGDNFPESMNVLRTLLTELVVK